MIAGGNAPADGTPHVTYGLGREDSISLFHNSEEVDYVVWGRDRSKNGRSYGRLINMSSELDRPDAVCHRFLRPFGSVVITQLRYTEIRPADFVFFIENAQLFVGFHPLGIHITATVIRMYDNGVVAHHGFNSGHAPHDWNDHATHLAGGQRIS